MWELFTVMEMFFIMFMVAIVAQQEEHCFRNKNLNLRPALHMYDLAPKSPLLSNQNCQQIQCFSNQDLQSPTADYFLFNPSSSLVMCFAYLAYTYVFISKAPNKFYFKSTVPNKFENKQEMLNSSSSYKIKLLLWFLIKSPSDLYIAW